ncbi:N4-gp56 family major capsid protein [Pseudomaricurvus alkylphenolicus]|uniref:N4-gp56 family major capsid protein n=1 Tax=Pseudomaricurvus alkylphenolicus TaxID=1306991 RepID=UPI001422F690|nr:N4-gp56 family major capsid protein [Pseudomaricurvus alkylphenolicus]NIB43811.1 N4-gp56 family major capsid protein [Pseudomaricurvus alkylphenolicus]
MVAQKYNTAEPRIGKTKGSILKHAVPVTCLGISGDQKKHKKNQGDTVVYRRWLPKGATNTDATSINQWSVSANDHLVSEGQTPEAETLTPQDITVQLQQYACLYSYTDKTADLYEDKIPDEMKAQAGERMGLVREMVDYGALKGCTNKFYCGGTSRATVDEPIGLPILRKATRSIKGNRGRPVSSVLDGSGDFNTSRVERGYLVFVHTDAENDIRNLPGFLQCAEYGKRDMVHDCEIGAVENYRFVVSPELTAIIDSGATLGATGMLSTGGSNIDVYPFIVVAADAWANLALRGMDSFDVIHVPVGKKDKADPLGQRGYIGTKFYSAAFVQNDGWMAVIEAGCTDI